MPVTIFFGLLVLGVIICLSSISHEKTRAIRMISGCILVILAFVTLILTFNMEKGIKARETSMVSEEITEYQLVTLQADDEISGSATRSYLEISEKTVFHFYYKTSKNGKEGFSPKTISSTDVFISETYEAPPMVREIQTTYAYTYTAFEKWWLQNLINDLVPYTKTSYEIYVPFGSIIETYNLTK